MTIIQLEYLIAVINNGSFSQAAEKCFVTQPSLSMQIKNLEDELGAVLLDRSKKPVVPTQAGMVVAERARQTLLAYESIREGVNELKGTVCGKLRLGVIPTVAPYLIPGFVGEFCERYPKVDLEIHECVTAEIVRRIDTDQLDAAIVAGGTCPDRITEIDMFNDRFFVYVSPNNPLYERGNIRIEDIDSRQLLLLSDGHCLRSQIMELCGDRSMSRNCSFECGSLETLMHIVDRTSMVTVIPEMCIPYIPDGSKACVKPLAKGATSRKISIAVRRTYAKQSVISAVRDIILAQYLIPIQDKGPRG